jgi:hypothetical protein
LWRICLTGNAENVSAAARCLGQLALHVTLDLSMMENIARKCFDAIYNIARKHENPTPRQMGLIQRSIIVLGAICEQAGVIYRVSVAVPPKASDGPDVGKADASTTARAALDEPSYLHLEETVAVVDIENLYTVIESCFQAICGSTYTAIKYLMSPSLPPDEAVRKRAAQALCSVFVGCPRLMLIAQADVRILFYCFKPCLNQSITYYLYISIVSYINSAFCNDCYRRSFHRLSKSCFFSPSAA